MATPPWTPWRKVVALRDDLRSGDLSLNIFAADLYDVVMGTGPRVYRDPGPAEPGTRRGATPGRQKRQGRPPA